MKNNTIKVIFFFLFMITNTVLSTQLQAYNELKTIDDYRCPQGYQIDSRIVEKEKNELNSIQKEYKKNNDEIMNLEKKINKLKKNKKKNIDELDKLEKNKSDLETYKIKINNKETDFNKSKEKVQCLLIDIDKVKYNTEEKDVDKNIKAYLLNSQNYAEVVTKDQDLEINSRDFTKMIVLSLINFNYKKNDFKKDIKIKVSDKDIEEVSDSKYFNIGLKKKKEYSIYDLIQSIKYNNYDDALNVICNYLFGNQQNTIKQVNEFLENLKIKNTKINNIFGNNKENENKTTLRDLAKIYRYNEKNSSWILNVSYETKVSSYGNFKSFNKENTIMDPNNNWHYNKVKEVWFSNFNNKDVSGIFTINRDNKSYTLILSGANSRNQLYMNLTRLFKNAFSNKYDKIWINKSNIDSVNQFFGKYNIPNKIDLKHLDKKSANITIKNNIRYNLPREYMSKVKYDVILNKIKNYKQLRQGSVIGTISIKDNVNYKIRYLDQESKENDKIKLVIKDQIKGKNKFNEFIENNVKFINKWLKIIIN